MPLRNNSRFSKNLIVFSGCFFILICFAYSVFLRKPWFNRPLHAHHEWLTAHSVCVTRNWLKDGAFNLKFTHTWNPASVEFDSLLSREPYISYPPGAFIPVFFLAKLLDPNAENLIPMFQAYNLFNHLAISLLLFLIMFRVISFFKYVNAANIFFSIVPSIIYLFTPPTLYWHQNVFFADQAVIIWFAVFVYFELKYFLCERLSIWNKLFFAGTIFLGTLTDWLFVFVIFTSVLLRIIFLRKAISFKQFMLDLLFLTIPMLLAMALFLFQVISVYGFSDGFYKLYSIFQMRHKTGPDGIATNLFRQHFIAFGKEYGRVLCFSGAFSIIAFIGYYIFVRTAIRNNAGGKMLNAYAYLVCLSLLPCLFQVGIFQQHSVVHDFSALKWAIGLSLVPFGIIPILLIKSIKTCKRAVTLLTAIIFLSSLICLALIFENTSKKYKIFFRESKDRHKKIGELVKRNVTYNDICFAFDFDIPAHPLSPIRLAYSGKRVYKINDFTEAKEMLSQFADKGATGKIFIAKNIWDGLKEEEKQLCQETYCDSEYYICKMKSQ